MGCNCRSKSVVSVPRQNVSTGVTTNVKKRVVCSNCRTDLSDIYAQRFSASRAVLSGTGRVLLHVQCPKCFKETVVPTHF